MRKKKTDSLAFLPELTAVAVNKPLPMLWEIVIVQWYLSRSSTGQKGREPEQKGYLFANSYWLRIHYDHTNGKGEKGEI